jgi:hypothetical protein
MKTIGLGLIAALALAGCSMESKTVEQSTNPSAGAAPLTYSARNMVEFDSAKTQADDWCYHNHLERAAYVDRTLDTAHFECASR